MVAICQREVAYTPDTVRGFVVLDGTLSHHGMPLVMAVEITKHCPHALNGRIHDARTYNAL
jgi:hypothetical protein